MRILSAAALLILVLAAEVGATDVPRAYRDVASAHGIPVTLFYAIALTESGYSQSVRGIMRPWPWTANFGGQGRYFASRTDAWYAIEEYIGEGHHSVDVGLMQINWRFHQGQLHSVWRALDPHINLAVAASILMACYQQHGDWWASVGCYHAPSNTSRAAAYRDRVRRHWHRLQS